MLAQNCDKTTVGTALLYGYTSSDCDGHSFSLNNINKETVRYPLMKYVGDIFDIVYHRASGKKMYDKSFIMAFFKSSDNGA